VFEKLGGQKSVDALVVRFFEKVKVDKILKDLFTNVVFATHLPLF
jgi:truncated hemoglobin YjbI